jgi:hypothetical protein
MVVNFMAREISQNENKLIQTLTLIKTRAISTNLLIQKMINQHI